MRDFQLAPDGTAVLAVEAGSGTSLVRLDTRGNALPWPDGSAGYALPTLATDNPLDFLTGAIFRGMDVAADGSFAVLTDAPPASAPQSPLVLPPPSFARLRVLRFDARGRADAPVFVPHDGETARDGLALLPGGGFAVAYLDGPGSVYGDSLGGGLAVEALPREVVVRRFAADGSPDGTYGTGGWTRTETAYADATLLPLGDGGAAVVGGAANPTGDVATLATRFQGGAGRAGAAATTPPYGTLGASVVSRPYAPSGPTAPGTARLDGSAVVAVGTEGADVIRVQVTASAVIVRINGVATGFGRSGVRNLYIDAGAGDDVVSAYDATAAVGGNVTIHGGLGNDTLVGGTGGGLILGEAGADELFVYGGTNAVDGGAGNDTLHGGSGTDAMLGGPGADVLYGGAGDDLLDGGRGG